MLFCDTSRQYLDPPELDGVVPHIHEALQHHVGLPLVDPNYWFGGGKPRGYW